eukprot:TRINITY_DN16604_c0_g5_i1.p3 TRINITY_DN16604_c0_g5~~TRINITY_DN16604_c0_g5_i1.p3  ORF type:complete len:123 (+),score=21.75 TRINITY_DN16604_c0_g5_i1:589-957(+)
MHDSAKPAANPHGNPYSIYDPTTLRHHSKSNKLLRNQSVAVYGSFNKPRAKAGDKRSTECKSLAKRMSGKNAKRGLSKAKSLARIIKRASVYETAETKQLVLRRNSNSESRHRMTPFVWKYA